jgi:hypothetical protein
VTGLRARLDSLSLLSVEPEFLHGDDDSARECMTMKPFFAYLAFIAHPDDRFFAFCAYFATTSELS